MKALYTGSFNPWHLGHQYVYERACKYFGKDNVFIGIGINPQKDESVKDKLNFFKWTIAPVTKNVITYTGLTSTICQEQNFEVLIRGIRPGKSLEYEEDLMYWNQKVGGTETVLIPTPPELNQISSSAIRELNKYPQVNLTEFINEDVYYRWKNGQHGIIFFGRSCCGKSTYLRNTYKLYDKNVVECDKVVWECIDVDDVDSLKSEMLLAIKYREGPTYSKLLSVIGESTDWHKMFNPYKDTIYDAPVIGNYWKYIPKEIRSRYSLIKITTSEENREKFCKAKGWDKKMLESLDYYYQDPPYWDEEIVIKNQEI